MLTERVENEIKKSIRLILEAEGFATVPSNVELVYQVYMGTGGRGGILGVVLEISDVLKR